MSRPALDRMATRTLGPSPADPEDPMAFARRYAPDLYSAGQPDRHQLATVAARGVRTVINLRPGHEPIDYDEPAEVARLGLGYVHLPIAAPADLDRDHVQAFADAVARARDAGPVLVHCASANRVGAMVALQKGWLDALGVDAALQAGRAAGLGALELRVAELLLQPSG